MLGMPRIEIEFEFNMDFCFGIIWHRILFFHSDLQHIAQHIESDRLINIVFVRPSVRPFFRSQFMNVGP